MKSLLLIFYLLVVVAGVVLRWLNLRHLRKYGSRVPTEFAEVTDPETLRRTAAYTVARSRLELAESLIGQALVLAFLFGGLLPLYDRWIGTLSAGFVARGVLFFLGLALLQGLLEIPFSLYRNFRLESRFGFNALTLRLWLSDRVKSTLLSAVLLTGVVAGALGLIRLSPHWWWLWVWLFLALVTLFLMYLSPYLIEPLFFTFEPVRRAQLKQEIRSLMNRAGLRVEKVLQVDASRRSRHSNAYFTGIGRVKRIVLFDTLLEQMTDREILGVLAHEAGHWKMGHLRKRLFATQVVFLAGLFLAYRLLAWEGLPGLLGLAGASFYAQVVIGGFLGSLAAFPFIPLLNGLSRRQEWQADRFARRLSRDPQALAGALVKLSRENLANLYPHPLYAWFYYSHPPLIARVRRLLRGGEPGKV